MEAIAAQITQKTKELEELQDELANMPRTPEEEQQFRKDNEEASRLSMEILGYDVFQGLNKKKNTELGDHVTLEGMESALFSFINGKEDDGDASAAVDTVDDLAELQGKHDKLMAALSSRITKK